MTCHSHNLYSAFSCDIMYELLGVGNINLINYYYCNFHYYCYYVGNGCGEPKHNFSVFKIQRQEVGEATKRPH